MVASLLSPEPRGSPADGRSRDGYSRQATAKLGAPQQTPPKGVGSKGVTWTGHKSPEEFAPVEDYKSPVSTPVGGLVHRAARRVQAGTMGAASPASAPFDQASPFEGAAHAGLVALLASSVVSRSLAECSTGHGQSRLSASSALIRGATAAAAGMSSDAPGSSARPALDGHRQLVEDLCMPASLFERCTPACGPVVAIRHCLGGIKPPSHASPAAAGSPPAAGSPAAAAAVEAPAGAPPGMACIITADPAAAVSAAGTQIAAQSAASAGTIDSLKRLVRSSLAADAPTDAAAADDTRPYPPTARRLPASASACVPLRDAVVAATLGPAFTARRPPLARSATVVLARATPLAHAAPDSLAPPPVPVDVPMHCPRDDVLAWERGFASAADEEDAETAVTGARTRRRSRSRPPSLAAAAAATAAGASAGPTMFVYGAVVDLWSLRQQRRGPRFLTLACSADLPNAAAAAGLGRCDSDIEDDTDANSQLGRSGATATSAQGTGLGSARLAAGGTLPAAGGRPAAGPSAQPWVAMTTRGRVVPAGSTADVLPLLGLACMWVFAPSPRDTDKALGQEGGPPVTPLRRGPAGAIARSTPPASPSGFGTPGRDSPAPLTPEQSARLMLASRGGHRPSPHGVLHGAPGSKLARSPLSSPAARSPLRSPTSPFSPSSRSEGLAGSAEPLSPSGSPFLRAAASASKRASASLVARSRIASPLRQSLAGFVSVALPHHHAFTSPPIRPPSSTAGEGAATAPASAASAVAASSWSDAVAKEQACLAELEAEQAALEGEEAFTAASSRHSELEPVSLRAEAVCTAAALLHKADLDRRVVELREELRQRMVEEKERLTKVAKRMADRVERLRDQAEEEARAAERERKEAKAKAKAEKVAAEARAAAIAAGQTPQQAAEAAAEALEDALEPPVEESEEKRAWRESLRAEGERCRRLAEDWKQAALQLRRRHTVRLFTADEAGFAPTAQDLTSRLSNFQKITNALAHALRVAEETREPEQTVLDLASFPFIKALNEDVFDKLDSIDLLQGSDLLLSPVFSTGGLVASLAVVAPGFWQRLWCGASVACAAVGPRPLHRGETDSLDSHLMARARSRIACLVAALAAGASMSVSDEQPLQEQQRAAPWAGDQPRPRLGARPSCPAARCDDSGPAGIENGEFGDQLWRWLARSANVCMDDNGAAYHRLQPFTVTIILRLAGWSLARRFGESFARMLKTIYHGRAAIANAAATKSGNSIEAGIIAENIRKEILKLADVSHDGRVALRPDIQRPVGWQGIALNQTAAVDVE